MSATTLNYRTPYPACLLGGIPIFDRNVYNSITYRGHRAKNSPSFRRQTPAFGGTPQAGKDQFSDKHQFLWQPVVQLHEQFLVREKLLLPGVAVNRHQLVELLA